MDIVVRPLPNLSSMILTWVAVLILFLVLKKFLHKPVTKFLSERREKIQTDLDGAKVLKTEAQSLKEDYEAKIDLARKESQEILEGARKRGDELRESIVAEARKDADDIVSNARKEINRERDVALQSIKTQAAEIGVMIASKIIEEQVTLDKQNGLIDKFIDEVGSSKWQS